MKICTALISHIKENLQKRRYINGNDEDKEEEGNTDVKKLINIEHLKEYAAQIFSNNNEENLQGTIAIRKLLSYEENSSFSQILKIGVLPYFVNFLKVIDNIFLRFLRNKLFFQLFIY